MANLIVPFGKFKGRPIEALLNDDSNYLEWMFSTPELIARLKRQHPAFHAAVTEAYNARYPTEVPTSETEPIIYTAKERLAQFNDFVVRFYQREAEAVPDVTALKGKELESYRLAMDGARDIRVPLESVSLTEVTEADARDWAYDARGGGARTR